MVIQNNTENVIVVSNARFKKEIPVKTSVDLSDEMLGGQSLKIEYFSLHGETKKSEYGVKRGFNRRLYTYFFNESVFPLKTVVNTENISELVLTLDEMQLPTFVFFFKKILLKSVACQKGVKFKNLFHTCKDKKRLLGFLFAESLISLILSIGFAAATVMFFSNGEAVIYKIFSVLITMVVLVCTAVNVRYFLSACKWKVD